MPDPGAAPGTEGSQSTTQWLGGAQNITDFIGRLVHIKQQHQAQALHELQGLYSLDQAGFPIADKAYTKLVKKSGMPLETDPEKLRAWLGAQAAQKQEKAGQPGAQPGGDQQMQAQQGAPPYMQEVIDAVNKVKSSGKPMGPEEMVGLQMKVLAGRAREQQARLQNTQAMTTQQKADNELQVATLENKGRAGDENARGQLLRMGNVPFSFDQERWTKLDDKGRSAVLDRFAGFESPAELAQRATNIAQSLITSGRLTDPQKAFKAADILSKGGQLPADIQGSMKPYTFSELSEAALLTNRLTEAGIPSDKMGQTIRAAQAGGLENALPTEMRPLALRAMEVEEGRLGLEQARLDIEGLRYAKELEISKKMAAAEARKGITDEQKQQLEEFKSLVELKKAGGKVPDDLIKGAQAKAARALGMDVSEVKTFWNFVTGGTELKFTPHVSEKGRSTIDRLTGGEEEQPNAGFQGFVKGQQKPSAGRPRGAGGDY